MWSNSNYWCCSHCHLAIVYCPILKCTVETQLNCNFRHCQQGFLLEVCILPRMHFCIAYICRFQLKGLLFGVHNWMFLYISACSCGPNNLQEIDTTKLVFLVTKKPKQLKYLGKACVKVYSVQINAVGWFIRSNDDLWGADFTCNAFYFI